MTSSSVAPDPEAEYDDRVEIDLGSLGPLVAKPHNPDNVVPVEEVAGDPDRPGLHRLLGQLGLQRPRAAQEPCSPTATARSCTRRSPPPPRRDPVRSWPRSRSRAYTASSRTGACGCSSRCAARAWAWARRRRLTRTRCGRSTGTSRAGRGRPRTRCSCARPRWRRSRCLSGVIEDPRSYGDPPELLPMPELRPYVEDVHIFAPASAEGSFGGRDPPGAEHQAPARAQAARRLAPGPHRHRSARRHLDRRPRARRRRGDGLPLERPRDRRVHFAPP